MKPKRYIIFSFMLNSLFSLLWDGSEVFAASIQSIATGSFNNTGIWQGGVLPGVSYTAVITGGDTVTFRGFVS